MDIVVGIRNIIFRYYWQLKMPPRVTLQHRLGAWVRVMILSFVKHLESRFLLLQFLPPKSNTFVREQWGGLSTDRSQPGFIVEEPDPLLMRLFRKLPSSSKVLIFSGCDEHKQDWLVGFSSGSLGWQEVGLGAGSGLLSEAKRAIKKDSRFHYMFLKFWDGY